MRNLTAKKEKSDMDTIKIERQKTEENNNNNK